LPQPDVIKSWLAISSSGAASPYIGADNIRQLVGLWWRNCAGIICHVQPILL